MNLPYPELMPNTVAKSPQEALNQHREYKHRIWEWEKFSKYLGSLLKKPDDAISHTLTRQEWLDDLRGITETKRMAQEMINAGIANHVELK